MASEIKKQETPQPLPDPPVPASLSYTLDLFENGTAFKRIVRAGRNVDKFPMVGNKVTIKYKANFNNTMYDTTDNHIQPMTFTLGDGQVLEVEYSPPTPFFFF
eukprot:m.271146 g.271146  ORF g.271146 m.271146 type:complete len:103 (-) comp16267_c1_seq8:1938-2246(-)